MKACFAIIFLLTAVRMDLSFERIKNGWILVGLAAGTAFWIPRASVESGIDLMAGVLLPVVICWIPFLMHALGAGDIKLFSVIGCLYGGRDAIMCIGYSFLTAAVFSVWKMIRYRRFRTSLINGFRYFQQIFREGAITPYVGREDPRQRIHFSLSVLIGFSVLLGVKYCEGVQLY